MEPAALPDTAGLTRRTRAMLLARISWLAHATACWFRSRLGLGRWDSLRGIAFACTTRSGSGDAGGVPVRRRALTSWARDDLRHWHCIMARHCCLDPSVGLVSFCTERSLWSIERGKWPLATSPVGIGPNYGPTSARTKGVLLSHGPSSRVQTLQLRLLS